MSTVMSAVETLESLQEALAPLEILQNDQAELGSWIHDSFSALEKLHGELTQWQSELARKETELDLRQDALGKTKQTDKNLQKQVVQLEQELAAAQEEVRQLEEENTEQLQEYERLEARCSELEAEYEAAEQRIKRLEAALEDRPAGSPSEGEQWRDEFRDLRGELERYHRQLAEQLARAVGHEAYTPLSAGAAHAKSVELRRRAQSRREAKEHKDPQAGNLE